VTIAAGRGGKGSVADGSGGALNIYTGAAGDDATTGVPGVLTIKVGGSSGTTVATASAAGGLALGRGTLKVPVIAGAITDYDSQAATLVIAGMLGGIVTQNSKTGASTATTPTGAEISAGVVAQYGSVAVGDSFIVTYYNRGDQTSTLTAGASGVTMYGTVAVLTHVGARLHFINTGTNAWSCYTQVG
jgi:hypothetical protein